MAKTLLIKPTLRKSNEYLSTFVIRAHLGIVDVIEAMITDHVTYGNSLPTSRQTAMRLAVEFREEYGSRGKSLDREPHSEVDRRCAMRAAQLFPDLAAGIDLSVYGLTHRVARTPAQEALAAQIDPWSAPST